MFAGVSYGQQRYTIEDIYSSDSLKKAITKDFFLLLNEYKKGENEVVLDKNVSIVSQ